MQQLLKPAPTCVFSDINASFNYEIILYLESRITLADACSLPCHLDFDNITKSSDQEKGYSTLAKSFVEKVQKLESDFQSLERTTSILDIILEIQDIERLSVINRLAKFHSRAKTITRSVPQRYVELQKPGELPEPLGPLQCLAL
ncbi:dentin sialophosphoprotein-related [Raphanus sativus]|nr:dentin sialophosphoprotein-related [Raphanus sativus]